MTINEERPDDERTDLDVVNVLIVMAAIAYDLKGQCGVGRIPCPVCTTGVVGYSTAGKSRSVAARCSTPGCVAFLS